MFDVTEEIEEKYLYNFTEKEKRAFRQEHQLNGMLLQKHQLCVYEQLAHHSPTIFKDKSSTTANSLFEIRYTFNRLKMNDPRETSLVLNILDPVVPNTFYLSNIVESLKNNTYCTEVVLNGVRMTSGYTSVRSFNDSEAGIILQALSEKKLHQLTLANAPLLTDETFQQIATLLSDPQNQWAHVTLGEIIVTPAVAKKLRKTKKVSFTPINQVVKRPGLWRSFWNRFEGRVRNT